LATFFTILHDVFDVFPEVLIGISIDVLVNKQNSFLAHWGLSMCCHSYLFLLG
jgi:ATP-binding cassette, subfamily B, bacterial